MFAYVFISYFVAIMVLLFVSLIKYNIMKGKFSNEVIFTACECAGTMYTNEKYTKVNRKGEKEVSFEFVCIPNDLNTFRITDTISVEGVSDLYIGVDLDCKYYYLESKVVGTDILCAEILGIDYCYNHFSKEDAVAKESEIKEQLLKDIDLAISKKKESFWGDVFSFGAFITIVLAVTCFVIK